MKGEAMRDVGLLILRIGIGVMFIMHGYPKITGGTEMWTKVGGAMSVFGIASAPAFWGFMASVAEFGGGICLVLGVAFRLACALMGFTMLVASLMLLKQGQGFVQASHPLELLVLFVALLFIGAGKFSLAEKLNIALLK